MYYTVIKHSGHVRALDKCRKHSPAARVFYIFLVFSNARHVLSQCNTRLRLLYLLNINDSNSTFPSCLKPLYQSEAWCITAIHVKMSLICMWMKCYFHMKEWTPRLALINKLKWPIAIRKSNFHLIVTSSSRLAIVVEVIYQTRHDSVSSGYPKIEKRLENTTRSWVFLTKFEVFR